jgi:hypothetical protein
MLLGPDGVARLLFRPGVHAMERGAWPFATAATVGPGGEVAVARADGSSWIADKVTTSKREERGRAWSALAFSEPAVLGGVLERGDTMSTWARAKGWDRADVALGAVRAFDRVAWSPLGDTIALAGADGLGGVSGDPASLPAVLARGRADVRAVGFAPDGAVVVATDAGTVEIAEQPSKDAWRTLATIGEPLVAVAVHPNGRVAVASESGRVHVLPRLQTARPEPTIAAPAGDTVELTGSGNDGRPRMAGVRIDGVGDPPVTVALIRRRLAAIRARGATPTLLWHAVGPPPADDAVLRALAAEAGARYEVRKPPTPDLH